MICDHEVIIEKEKKHGLDRLCNNNNNNGVKVSQYMLNLNNKKPSGLGS